MTHSNYNAKCCRPHTCVAWVSCVREGVALEAECAHCHIRQQRCREGLTCRVNVILEHAVLRGHREGDGVVADKGDCARARAWCVAVGVWCCHWWQYSWRRRRAGPAGQPSSSSTRKGLSRQQTPLHWKVFLWRHVTRAENQVTCFEAASCRCVPLMYKTQHSTHCGPSDMSGTCTCPQPCKRCSRSCDGSSAAAGCVAACSPPGVCRSA